VKNFLWWCLTPLRLTLPRELRPLRIVEEPSPRIAP